MSDRNTILRNAGNVDWRQLVHAYGQATELPEILSNMLSDDERKRAHGWDSFYGGVNHQGDFYDSTVATVPFLIAALSCEEVPCREMILSYFYGRCLDAPHYGGDPMLTDPPGGVDIPTPLVDPKRAGSQPIEVGDGDEQMECADMRPMSLCAWQFGRAVKAGQETYETLLWDSDKSVAGSAANLMMLWHETRSRAKAAMAAAIDAESDPLSKATMLLKYGVYRNPADVAALEYWSSPSESLEVRVAASLCWALIIDPQPLPSEIESTLREASVSTCNVFGMLPWVGVFHRGLWILPRNIAHVILPLAENQDQELRWRAVQGLNPLKRTGTRVASAPAIEVLGKRLHDDSDRIRAAAAFALAEFGEAVSEVSPGLADTLIGVLADENPDVCGHCARLIAAIGAQLDATQRVAAAREIHKAAKRFKQKSSQYVQFTSTGFQADRFLEQQYDAIKNPVVWDIDKLLALYAFPEAEANTLTPAACDRLLAEIYTQNPDQTIRSVIRIIDAAENRSATMGGANWLASLGPAAKSALMAIDACDGKIDNYIDAQLKAAAKSIRRSLDVPTENQEQRRTMRGELDLLMRIPDVDAIESLLTHDQFAFRFLAAEAIAQTEHDTWSRDCIDRLAETFVSMLEDQSDEIVGIAGEFECAGRIYHWRSVRQSPADMAIRALFAIGVELTDEAVLNAMIEQTMRTSIRCGKIAIAPTYSSDQWRAACEAAGDIPTADSKLRAARQRCHQAIWSGESGDEARQSAQDELNCVIEQLSGRLIPANESEYLSGRF